MIRWEVWVSMDGEPYRFNACFATREEVERERRWYENRGMRIDTVIRMRTTRYQRHEHITTGEA